MSPIAQYTAVAAITFAVLGFQTVALALLGITFVLLWTGFLVGLIPAGGKLDDDSS